MPLGLSTDSDPSASTAGFQYAKLSERALIGCATPGEFDPSRLGVRSDGPLDI
jgi:hypothetical protein